jgi:hypothetical protein
MKNLVRVGNVAFQIGRWHRGAARGALLFLEALKRSVEFEDDMPECFRTGGVRRFGIKCGALGKQPDRNFAAKFVGD